MKSLSEIILNELNPKHDFDRTGHFKLPSPSATFKEELKIIGGDWYLLANSLKHYVRGWAVGAGVGALAFYIAREDPKIGAIVCGGWGLGIDIAQYLIRGVLIPTTKEGVKLAKEDYITVRNWLKNP